MRTTLFTALFVLLPYGVRADSATVWQSVLVQPPFMTYNADSVTEGYKEAWQMVAVYTPMGDMNADGKVTLADIIYMVNWILKDQAPPVVAQQPDVMQAVSGDTVVLLRKPYVKDEKEVGK